MRTMSQQRLGPQAQVEQPRRNGKKPVRARRFGGVNMLQFCSVSNSLSRTTLSIKWEVYFSKERSPLVFIVSSLWFCMHLHMSMEHVCYISQWVDERGSGKNIQTQISKFLFSFSFSIHLILAHKILSQSFGTILMKWQFCILNIKSRYQCFFFLFRSQSTKFKLTKYCLIIIWSHFNEVSVLHIKHVPPFFFSLTFSIYLDIRFLIMFTFSFNVIGKRF